MSDELIERMLAKAAADPEGLERRAQEWQETYSLPLEWVETADGWMARKGSFVGVGATKQAAHEDLYRKLRLQLKK
jgi:hypothetical protein